MVRALWAWAVGVMILEMVEFTDHAVRKIEQRGLSKAKILTVLAKPEYVYPSYSGRMIAYRKIGKLYLAVIYKTEFENTIVLTAHWEKGFRPKKGVS